MPALKVSSDQRAELRSQAHALKPVVLVGAEGLTDAVLAEIKVHLAAHQLIKIRVFGDEREERIAIYEQICDKLNAAPIQHIGKLLVVYRPKKEDEKQRSDRKGPGMREVTIVKPSASGTKRPSVTRVLLKGNERVTAGGNIKRAKSRQSSPKKSSLGS